MRSILTIRLSQASKEPVEIPAVSVCPIDPDEARVVELVAQKHSDKWLVAAVSSIGSKVRRYDCRLGRVV
jgi:hypothetical protein